jgi:hypothetical protein
MSYNPNRKVVFPSSGNYTWVCPIDVNYVNIVLVGAGGGGGGGGAGGTSVSHGGGGYAGGGGCAGGHGGSGIFNSYQSIKVSPGQTYPITVGTSGTSGAAGLGSGPSSGGNGGAGGFSSFTFPNGIILKAAGGPAGVGGPHGANATTGGNGAGGATGTPSQNLASAGLDGQQAGLAGGGSINISSAPEDATSFQSYLYQIYTDVSFTPLLAGQLPNFYPFGNSPSFTSGNVCNDTGGVITALTESGTGISGSYGGGAGGIMYLSEPIPLYWTSVDFSAHSTIRLPSVFSASLAGLGNGGAPATAGSAPLSSNVYFWVDSTATQIGFGAGGLGGPGGGGGGGGTVSGNASSLGGSGYHGDIGLGGLVTISW